MIRKKKALLSILLIFTTMLLLAAPVSAKKKKTPKVKPVLNFTSVTIGVGQSLQLSVINGVKVKWSTSKKKVAKVKRGYVTAKKTGKAIITATAKGKKAKCKIVVVAEPQDLSRYFSPVPTPTPAPAPFTPPQEIDITIDNWSEYFEVREEADWNNNAFGEPTEFKGTSLCICYKEPYKSRIITYSFKCEYVIRKVLCNVSYDMANNQCILGDPISVIEEHTSTSEPRYQDHFPISFSLGYNGQEGSTKTNGSFVMEDFRFVEMKRAEGRLTLQN